LTQVFKNYFGMLGRETTLEAPAVIRARDGGSLVRGGDGGDKKSGVSRIQKRFSEGMNSRV
jgi:hypothetical protein